MSRRVINTLGSISRRIDLNIKMLIPLNIDLIITKYMFNIKAHVDNDINQ